MKILVTCPPMLRMISAFNEDFERIGATVTAPEVIQTLSVDQLKELVPLHDGWIIGDDPATKEVFEAGVAGSLRAAVKWGIGVDNVDFDTCRRLGIPITNTPNMFGGEVADIALGYVIGLARHTFEIDRGVRKGDWIKPSGISLEGKTAALIGYGDIGKSAARRLLACGMRVVAYDPFASDDPTLQVFRETWPNKIEEADFVVVNCALTPSSFHLLNDAVFSKMKVGVRIVNVGRGPIIDEKALERALSNNIVFSAALDVFEVEPLPSNSPLREHPRCIFGSHNASNTQDAVNRTSRIAIAKLAEFLGTVKNK